MEKTTELSTTLSTQDADLYTREIPPSNNKWTTQSNQKAAMKTKNLSTKTSPGIKQYENEKSGYPHIHRYYYNYDLLYIQKIMINQVEKITHKIQKTLKYS